MKVETGKCPPVKSIDDPFFDESDSFNEGSNQTPTIYQLVVRRSIDKQIWRCTWIAENVNVSNQIKNKWTAKTSHFKLRINSSTRDFLGNMDEKGKKLKNRNFEHFFWNSEFHKSRYFEPRIQIVMYRVINWSGSATWHDTGNTRTVPGNQAY